MGNPGHTGRWHIDVAQSLLLQQMPLAVSVLLQQGCRDSASARLCPIVVRVCVQVFTCIGVYVGFIGQVLEVWVSAELNELVRHRLVIARGRLMQRRAPTWGAALQFDNA